MSERDRKARIREYKESHLPAGVFRVRNIAAGRSFVGTSPNLPGMLNRQRFQLEMGSHADKDLQRDWNELGADAFAFEVLDRIEPTADGSDASADDLAALKELWVEKLSATGEQFYGRPG